ncbi:putative bifunctional diguanylate cyclase/phosphodiesterase [Sphingomonas immobilis]|uniref:EAL domain-containing protein n=1 Tax=Sphingomonas immobilis TaxID=3063997 RepID=A0ABT9A1C8_9SPHN|nr:EAL domain-containing protein [Sphingomonas sp. CA1-15]MDO7842512.1 EAL domain-containing protein [Sphingomonas sp. CA1-15]
MTSPRSARLVALYAGVAVAVVLLAWVDFSASALVFAVLVAAFAAGNWRLQHKIERARAQLDETGEASLEQGIGVLKRKLAVVSHRLALEHPVSGLPMREELVDRIRGDAQGILGAIAFVDIERLTAFDPAQAERVLATSVARLRRMLPADRFLAQVDRGHVGIWFGAMHDETVARAELQAITYALGEAIVDEEREIMPQVRLRVGRYDATEGASAGAFLARTLASFAAGEGATATDRVDAEQAERARDRYGLEQDLRQAIARRELRLELQPLIDATRHVVTGAEALLRWDHPVRGPVSPAVFIPVMEAIGLASEIGTWVINAAAREARDWQARGFRGCVAINVSGLQVERDDLPAIVARTLDRYGLDPASFEIELTESMAMNNTDHCRAIFWQLRKLGVKLAIDDFGTGYSGFSSVRNLLFDKIKIDREFVTDVDTRKDSQAICQSIIALGRGLGVRVLAEGVETHAEYAWLRKHGCHHFQGYYFSRPLTPEAFLGFVRHADELRPILSLGSDIATITGRLSA